MGVSNIISLSPLIAYSFYIYFDFSSYTDIAIGSARLFGIKVPENFNLPYLKTNVRDFWNSWHMSLSFWLRDYVFMPTGKKLFKTFLKKYPTMIAVISYIITFTLCGLWHGGKWNFLVWGLYYGILLGIYHIYVTFMPKKITKSNFYNSPFLKTIFILSNFCLITLGWIFFAYDINKAIRIIKHFL
jgi:alginate O-acetyltransferase complex protein AlgI